MSANNKLHEWAASFNYTLKVENGVIFIKLYGKCILAQLQAYRLVGYVKEWRNHHYYALIDAHIVYSKGNGLKAKLEYKRDKQ